MNFLAWSLLLLSCAAPFSSAAQLKDVKSVYLFPMTGGLDQLIASRIARDHVFQVVSDPKLADAVITDQLGAAFEYKLDHIVAPPPPPVPAGGNNTQNAEPHASSFSRARGTVFLVDAKSKQVLWSLYERPKNSSPQALDRTAKKVVGNLAVTLNPPTLKQ